MEDGKALAKDLLPFVAKRLQDAANKNDALAGSLKNLNVRLGQSKVGLQIFQDTLFSEGVEEGLKFTLNGFNDLMKSSKALAAFLGGAFKGAVVAAVAPFRLAYAAIYDIVNLVNSDWLPAQKDLSNSILNATGKMFGFVAAIWAAKKAWNTFMGARKMAKGAANLLSGAADTGVGGKKKGGILSAGVQKVFVTNMPRGGLGSVTPSSTTSKGGKGGKLKGALGKIPVVAEIAAASYLIAEGIDAFGQQFEGYRKADVATSKFLSGAFTSGRDYSKPSNYLTGNLSQGAVQPQKIEIELKSDMLDAKISNGVDDGIGKVFSTGY